jgi:hypothetical protein
MTVQVNKALLPMVNLLKDSHVNVMNALQQQMIAGTKGEAKIQRRKHHSTLGILAVSISVLEVAVNQGYKVHTI